MSLQADLFASNHPQVITNEDGCAVLHRSWLKPERSAELFTELSATLAWQQTHLQMYGKSIAIPRLNAWYGDAGSFYSYSGAHFAPHPWVNALQVLREQLQPVAQARFNSVLANLYRDERDSVAWHSDDEHELGPTPTIASLSLGAERDFVLRHKQSLRQLRVTLHAGDLLIMSGRLQRCWQHQLPKANVPLGPRINLTYRRVLG
ncbi:alpha-ketoglutarate-dependent dioxygenase AlkB family protein [Gilvimarinus polysaccharolyticus]|uniref:alpha-ketoglutarate-dependent dioxygenase AlkB family protein n=1 Tax=Gilvimarinus polysaccharolyticus TaxID=863921 RepID=UPI000A05743C|nr:alpha-ketoglutarate-dependent dioxygenase AlkB [Gilvimarinus polysaccharolyticus]